MKKILSLAIFCSVILATQAQTQTSNTDPKTGIKVSSKISPLPTENTNPQTLETQIANLELLQQNALQNSNLVADGTAGKYGQVLNQKKAELALQKANNQKANNQNANPVKSSVKKDPKLAQPVQKRQMEQTKGQK